MGRIDAAYSNIRETLLWLLTMHIGNQYQTNKGRLEVGMSSDNVWYVFITEHSFYETWEKHAVSALEEHHQIYKIQKISRKNPGLLLNDQEHT